MALPAVTLSGTLQNVAGAGSAGTVIISLVNFGDNPPEVSGTMLAAPVSISVQAAANGTWSTTLWGNDQLSPKNTFYQVQVIPAGAQVPAWSASYIFNSGTYDLSTQTPVSQTQQPVPPYVLSGIVAQTAPARKFFDSIGSNGTFGYAQPFPEIYDVKTYGATGNGSTDDTVAIQSAITACQNAGGGTVYFPAGTYIVSPPTTAAVFTITTTGNIAFRGNGVGVSTIKIKASAGNYDCIFGGESTAAPNLTISDLTVDQNTANNAVASLSTYPRMVIWTGTGVSDLTVVNAEFINLGCTNCIVSYSQKTVISGCRFNNPGLGSTYFDHSTLYIVGENSTISNNIFIGTVNGAGSVCAIETHGGRQTVTGNSIDSYWVGMNITGVNASVDTVGVSVTGNTIVNAYYGIQLWSYQNGSHTTGYGLRDVVVSNNTLRLTQTSWTTNPGAGGANLGNSSGIFVNPDSNLPLRDVSIIGNVVEYDLEANNTYPWNSAGFGIGYWDALETNNIDGLKISGNSVINCPLPAIRSHVDGGNIDISSNLIVNSGSSLNASVTSGYQCGIFVANYNTLTAVRINNNIITDNNSTTRMVYAMLIEPESGTDVVAIGNVITCSGGTTTAFSSGVTATSGVNPVVQYVQVKPGVTSSNLPSNVGHGSTVTDPTNNKHWHVLPSGTSWSAVSYASAVPASGSWEAGDIVWNTAPTSGGYAGWMCYSSGSPGSWAPLPLLDSGGNLSLNGQPSGQYLAYRTSSGADRWTLATSGTESGSDAGSNLFLASYHDNGTQIGAPIEVVRSTGEVSLSGTLYVGSTLTVLANGASITGGTVTDTLKVTGDVGFFGTTPTTKPTITGAKLASDTVMANLLTALANLGLVTDSTT
jgi:hypothetical protein